jgi:hypothetical protein
MRSCSSQGRRPSFAHSRSAYLPASGKWWRVHPAYCLLTVPWPVHNSASRTRQQTPALQLTVGVCVMCAEAGNGLPPAPRRSFSSGGWKGRNQQDAGGGQQYESVVVRTATGGHVNSFVGVCSFLLVGGGCACALSQRPNECSNMVWMHDCDM